MLNFVLDFLFPPSCGICGKINKNWLCINCEKRIKILEKNILIKTNKNFDKLFYIFDYDKIIRKLILRYKFSNKPYLSSFFAQIISKNEKICSIFNFYDIIIPVPMNIKKKRKRGYNQTELIIKKIVEIHGSTERIPVLETNMLLKTKETKTQSILKEKERRDNVKDAFIVNNNAKIKNKKIILFDDIYTTGATVNECSRVLKQAGASEILVLVIARD